MKEYLVWPAGLLTGAAAGLAVLAGAGDKTTRTEPASAFEELERPNEALEALQFLTTAAAFPGKDIPANAYAKAWAYYRSHFGSTGRQHSGSGSGWQSLGPTNVGGRTLCMAFHPTDTSTIWMGSAGGGLWKTTTSGIGPNAWTYIPTGFPTLGVSSIAIDPANPATIYIGTGETYSYGSTTYGLVDRTTRGTFGNGILKSTDGGLTWSVSLNWQQQQQRGVWEIILDPASPATLYAATTEGVYKTTDSGTTWTQVLARQMVMDLAQDPANPAILYAGVGNLNSPDHGLYKTTDAGLTWTKILPSGTGGPTFQNDGRITVAISPDNPNLVVAHVCDAFSSKGIYRSTDKGATWTAGATTDLASYQGWYAKGLVFKPGSPNTLLAGGVEVFRSFNTGTSFSLISNNNFPLNSVHPDIHDIVVNPLDPNKIYVLTDGGLYRSNNFGTTFYACNDGYVTSQCYIGSVSQTDSLLGLAGLQDNYTQRFSGPTAWDAVLGGDGCYNAINPQNDTIQYASYQYLGLNRSADRGQTFYQNIQPQQWGTRAFMAPFVLAPSQPQVLYGGSIFLHRSANSGTSWQHLAPDTTGFATPVLSIAVAPTHADSVYFATVPDSAHPLRVYRSPDGGTTFTDITGPLPNRYLRRLTVSPINSQEVYAVFSGFGTGHIFKSTDAGSTWTDISGSLPDLPFHCLAIDPLHPQHLFIGSDYTVFYSPNGGSSWRALDTGLPEAVMVFDLVISPADRSLRAFTHGHGVFKHSLDDLGVITAAPAAAAAPALLLYPNPAQGVVQLRLAAPAAGPAAVQVLDLRGNVVLRQHYGLPQPGQPLPLSVDRLPAGAYLVTVQTGRQRHTGRLIVLPE